MYKEFGYNMGPYEPRRCPLPPKKVMQLMRYDWRTSIARCPRQTIYTCLCHAFVSNLLFYKRPNHVHAIAEDTRDWVPSGPVAQQTDNKSTWLQKPLTKLTLPKAAH